MSEGAGRSADALVAVAAVSKAFRNGSGETRVLEDVSFDLLRGQTSSLMGASGSGKSTLLSILAGLMRPDAGRIAFDGAEVTGLDDSARAALRARRIGIVLQSGNLIPFLTATENVELAITLAGGRRARSRAKGLLAEVGLGDRLDQPPRQLSGGEAQRVAVAMALANEPDLLLADEATGELDSATAEHVTGIIFEASREHGLTVLLVTHNDELARLAENRLRLENGQVRRA